MRQERTQQAKTIETLGSEKISSVAVGASGPADGKRLNNHLWRGKVANTWGDGVDFGLRNTQEISDNGVIAAGQGSTSTSEADREVIVRVGWRLGRREGIHKKESNIERSKGKRRQSTPRGL